MALIEVKVPQLSESVAEATLLQWKKKPGEAVAADEILIEIETDKVVLEVPAPAAGVIGQIVKADGATVVADEVIAIIDTEAKAGAVAPAPAAAPVVTPAAAPAPAPAALTRAPTVTSSPFSSVMLRMTPSFFTPVTACGTSFTSRANAPFRTSDISE